MRQRMIRYGFLCWAVWLCSGQTHIRAESLTFLETAGLGFVQTDFGPGANVGGNDPLTFNKFNPGSGQIPIGAVLENVAVSFNWGFRSQLSASFPSNSNPSSSVTINAFGGITLGRPDVSIAGPGPDPSLFLFPTQTFQNAASFTSATASTFTTTPPSTYFHSLPTGYVLPPEDQPLTLRDAGSPLVTNISSGSADFAKFLGAGTVTFDVLATAGYNVPNTSGNASGTSLTSAFPEVTLTYTYSITAIPEPNSLVLMGMGMGMGGCFVARRFRRSRGAFSSRERSATGHIASSSTVARKLTH